MKRIQSLDVLRGLIMAVLMAIDHVRVYAGVPAGGPDPAIFFTRWITHFCAPGFAFFAGTAAFLYGIKLRNTKELARYLFTRGLMLIVLEITVIRLFWTFNLNLGDFMLAGVIWMLGWCMVLLGTMVRFEARTIGIIGLCIIFFQQLFAYVPNILPGILKSYWEFIYTSGNEGPSWIAILYVIVPWIGVMMAGYGFEKLFFQIKGTGGVISLGYRRSSFSSLLAAGTIDQDEMPFLFNLLKSKKIYPRLSVILTNDTRSADRTHPAGGKSEGCCCQFLQHDRPGAVLLLSRTHTWSFISVPLSLTIFRSETSTSRGTTRAPFAQVPEENRWSLGLLYFVFAVDVTILYFLSKWYSKRKLKFL